MKIFLMVSYCVISVSAIYAQNPEWNLSLSVAGWSFVQSRKLLLLK